LGIGANSSLTVGKQRFDIETEARSGDHIIIDTTVYAHGRVLYRRVANCDDFPRGEKVGEVQLCQRVDAQHRSVLEDLRSGVLKFTQPGPVTQPMNPAAPIAFPKGIEVRLLNSGSWLSAGTASLNIEVRGRFSGKPAAGMTVEVAIEGAQPPFRVQAGTDPHGRVSLVFPMPKLRDGSELIIRASGTPGHDEQRFKLKQRVPVARKNVQSQ
jgi:hypothetical protein